jgi:hypothetical protein
MHKFRLVIGTMRAAWRVGYKRAYQEARRNEYKKVSKAIGRATRRNGRSS